MKLEQILFPREGVCRLIVSADAAELAAAQEKVHAERPRLTGDDLGNETVNRALLDGISPVYQEAQKLHGITPIKDPDFDLLAYTPGKGMTAACQFFILPELTLGRYTGFVQAVVPQPVKEYAVLMEINKNHGPAYNTASPEEKAAMEQAAVTALYQRSCKNAELPAQLRLVQQLGDLVTGKLDDVLLHDAFFDELENFSLRLEANKVSFDMYLKATHQTREEWDAALHKAAERKLRTALGLLMVAARENLSPTPQQVADELHHWNTAKYRKPTFLANDVRRIRQRMACDLARQFILERSTLTPPPAQPVIQKAEPDKA